MVSITIINLQNSSDFPSRFKINAIDSNVNPLKYSRRIRNQSLYAELYIATAYDQFTFPSSVMWEGEHERFIIALCFTPITEISGMKLDPAQKASKMRLGSNTAIGFYKVRTASPADLIDKDATVNQIVEQNKEKMAQIEEGWKSQIQFVKEQFERRENSYKGQIQELENALRSLMEESISDSMKLRHQVLDTVKKTAMAGSSIAFPVKNDED